MCRMIGVSLYNNCFHKSQTLADTSSRIYKHTSRFFIFQIESISSTTYPDQEYVFEFLILI